MADEISFQFKALQVALNLLCNFDTPYYLMMDGLLQQKHVVTKLCVYKKQF